MTRRFFAPACAAILLFSLAGPVRSDEAGPTGWPTYGGDPGGTRYSALEEITPGNVEELEVAWTYHTGDVAGVRPGAEKVAFVAPTWPDCESQKEMSKFHSHKSHCII